MKIMEMKMQLGERELDSIKVHQDALGDKRYLDWLKQGLRRKHQSLLATFHTEPLFFIVGLNENEQINGQGSYEIKGIA